jgi:hypothetical protein
MGMFLVIVEPLSGGQSFISNTFPQDAQSLYWLRPQRQLSGCAQVRRLHVGPPLVRETVPESRTKNRKVVSLADEVRTAGESTTTSAAESS